MGGGRLLRMTSIRQHGHLGWTKSTEPTDPYGRTCQWHMSDFDWIDRSASAN